MRHGKKFNHLSRKTAHRKAMLSNMACSLIENKRINTTVAKAKALRVYIEPLLTKSKTDSTHSRRMVFRYLQNKDVVGQLFRDVAPKIADREGGYTRIIRTGYRLGDNAEMCIIELVDFNELYSTDKPKKTRKRSRRGGGAKVAGETTTEETVVEEAVEETSNEVESEETVDTVEEATTEEVTEEAPVEEEVKEEEPAAEETQEEPTAEAEVEAPAEEEVKEEAPAAEEKEEEPAAEEKSEEDPKAESDDSEEEEKKED